MKRLDTMDPDCADKIIETNGGIEPLAKASSTTRIAHAASGLNNFWHCIIVRTLKMTIHSR